MKIICVGNVTYDITFPVDSFPVENTKTRLTEKVECGGGPANNAAYLLGKWGSDVYFSGVIGKDYYGNIIKNELESVHVNTKYLTVSQIYQTTTAIVINNKLNGSRTILTHKPVSEKLQNLQLDFIPDVILIDGHEYDASVDLINKYPSAISIIDAGRATDEVISLAKMCKYVVCSFDFALNVTKMKDAKVQNYNSFLKEIYKKMELMFSGIIVITLEEAGCLYKSNNEIKIIPAIKVKALDTTGAGDIFHGAFTYGIANNNSLEKSLILATIASGLSVERVGGRYSVPSLEEVLSYNGIR